MHKNKFHCQNTGSIIPIYIEKVIREKESQLKYYQVYKIH